MIHAAGSAATFDTDHGAGGCASAFRTAPGMYPRPVACHSKVGRHGLTTLHPALPHREVSPRPAMPIIFWRANHCNHDTFRHSPPNAAIDTWRAGTCGRKTRCPRPGKLLTVCGGRGTFMVRPADKRAAPCVCRLGIRAENTEADDRSTHGKPRPSPVTASAGKTRRVSGLAHSGGGQDHRTLPAGDLPSIRRTTA